MQRTVGLLITALLALACGQPADGPGSTAPDRDESLYLGTWELVEGNGPDGDIVVPSGDRITLIISEDSFGGGACNSYGSNDFTIDGSDLKVGGLGSTEMACDAPLMDAEQAYLTALVRADTIERRSDELMLSGDDVSLRYSFVPPPDTEELVGTMWKLESLIFGEGDEAVVSSARPAKLVLNDDGTLTGTTGCRRLDGEWNESGDQISFPIFGADGGCSEEMAEQDGAIVSMGDGFTFTIEEDVLTIDPRLGDIGLVYRAER